MDAATPETRQLERFLAWNFWGSSLATLFVTGVWWFYPWWLAPPLAAAVATSALITRSAQQFAKRGDAERAARRFSWGAWLMALIVGISIPLLFPVIVLVVFLPLAITIPYGSRRLQTTSFTVGAVLAALLAIASLFPPLVPFEIVPQGVLQTVNVVFIPLVATLFCFSLWSTYLRVRRSHEALLGANVALQQSESSLERKVEQRTAELEQSRAQLEEARDVAVTANAAKSRFLAAASHDLRQPIHALRLFAEALGDEGDVDRVHSLAARIRDSADSLTAMFDELLDLSRLESGAVEAHLTDFPIGPLFEQLGAELAPDARARGIALRVAPTHRVVHSDPLLLRRILQNLLVNALRYTERGRVLIGARRRGERLNIEVWDTGPGIPEAKLAEIFREFTQLDQARRSEGLGLGLAIVERLSRLLDYPLEVQSRIGKGSVFRISVPLSRATSSSRLTSGGLATGVGLAGRLVVIVDDDLNILDAMRLLIGGWGAEVLVARSADEALEGIELRARPPDVILADYSLAADATGADAIEVIRKACGAPVPALIITGETDPAVLERIRRSGFPHLIKPIPPARLRAALSSALRAGQGS